MFNVYDMLLSKFQKNRWSIGLLQEGSIVEQLKRVLNSIEEEIKSENSIWDKELLIFVVKPEMKELYNHFINGEVFFKYGKKQRMLESTYIINDSIRNLSNISLGKEIIKLQEKYNKL